MKKIERNEIEMTNYEGALYGTEMNTYYTGSKEGLMRAYEEGTVLEAEVASAGEDGSLVFYFTDDCIGFISAEEYEYNAEPKRRAKAHAIGHPKCFIIKSFTEFDDGTTEFELSRREVHRNYFENVLSKYYQGDVIPGKVKQVRPGAVYVDLGFGYTSLLRAEELFRGKRISVSETFSLHDNLLCVIAGFEDAGRVLLSHKELLGTNCMNLDEAGIKHMSIITAVAVTPIGDNAMVGVISPGLSVKIRFREGTALPAAGTVVRTCISTINRINDRVKSYFVAETTERPDFRNFCYFVPEKTIEHRSASEHEAA